MAFKSRITKQIEKETKQSKKENKGMNKAKVIALTVLSTLTILAAIAGIAYVGFQFGVSHEKGVQERVSNEAKVLTASVAQSPAPLK